MPPLGPLLFGMVPLLCFCAVLLVLGWWAHRRKPQGDDYPHEIGDGS